MPVRTEHLTPRLYQALEFAFELFGHDTRKQSQVPVMAHLLSVCAMVQQDGGDEDEAIAALLHDTLEDKPEQVNRELLRTRFGEKVLQLVEIATDTAPEYVGGEKEEWTIRKDRCLEHIRHAHPQQLRVSLADKIDNVRAILADYHRLGDALWGRFNAGKGEQVRYFTSLLQAFKDSGLKSPLLDEFERLVAQLNTEI